MATTAYKTAGTVAIVSYSGSNTTWSNATTTRLATVDASPATCTKASGSPAMLSHYLKCTNFGFTSSDVPSGATITGITISITRKGTNPSTQPVGISSAQILIAGAAVNEMGPDTTAWGTTYTEQFLFGPGFSFGASSVYASNFGFQISVGATTTGGTGSIDQIKISVTYTSSVSVTPSIASAASDIFTATGTISAYRITPTIATADSGVFMVSVGAYAIVNPAIAAAASEVFSIANITLQFAITEIATAESGIFEVTVIGPGTPQEGSRIMFSGGVLEVVDRWSPKYKRMRFPWRG